MSEKMTRDEVQSAVAQRIEFIKNTFAKGWDAAHLSDWSGLELFVTATIWPETRSHEAVMSYWREARGSIKSIKSPFFAGEENRVTMHLLLDTMTRVVTIESFGFSKRRYPGWEDGSKGTARAYAQHDGSHAGGPIHAVYKLYADRINFPPSVTEEDKRRGPRYGMPDGEGEEVRSVVMNPNMWRPVMRDLFQQGVRITAQEAKSTPDAFNDVEALRIVLRSFLKGRNDSYLAYLETFMGDPRTRWIPALYYTQLIGRVSAYASIWRPADVRPVTKLVLSCYSEQKPLADSIHAYIKKSYPKYGNDTIAEIASIGATRFTISNVI